MVSRGLWPSNPKVREFRLGVVEDPLPGHEQYKGWLSIPYLRPSENELSVVKVRFRRLDDGSPKYLDAPGYQPRLFNTGALLQHSPRVAITEGEIDAMTSHLCGIPTVGVPGVQTWKPHFREPFLGYRDVYIFADGDEPGRQFADSVAEKLPNAKVIPMPNGEDVNSLVINQGKSALLERINP